MDFNYKEKFFEIFRNVMNVNTIDYSYSLKTLPQWNSLKTVELIIEIESQFNIKLKRNQIPNMTSIISILEILENHFLNKDNLI
jgi:acyl carrier protein